jgi:hypothetical protein
MSLKKLILRPGVNRENTRYTSENGWYEGDKIRFRQGTPEKIGGWARISLTFFKGICRSLWAWINAAATYIGVGTNLKFYIERGGVYSDITPIRSTVTLTNPFTWLTSTTFQVTDAAAGYVANDFVTFSVATATGGIILNGEYQIVSVNIPTTTYVVSTIQDVSMATDLQTFTGQSWLSNGVAVTLATSSAGSTLPGGFTAGTTYYAVSTATNTFKLAAVPAGPAITATSLPGGVITATPQFTGSFTGAGGAVTAVYQINTGFEIQVQATGWGGGGWGLGGWGTGLPSASNLRLWSQINSGDNLVFGYIGGPIYYWVAAGGLNTRGVLLNSIGGIITTTTFGALIPATFLLQFPYPNGTGIKINFTAGGSIPAGMVVGLTYYVANIAGSTCNLSTDVSGSSLVSATSAGSGLYISELTDVPIIQNWLFISDTFKFLFAFGANDYSSPIQDPMLIRWSDQESVTVWYPQATNQAGSLRLSHGSRIVTAVQARQEILVWTDSSLYSLQYLQPPIVWGSQLLGDNLSIIGPNAVSYGSGIAFWMGLDKFYVYDGRTQTLPCDLRQFIFNDPGTRINLSQAQQVYCSTNEGFNEVWWFYPSENSTENDTYIVYNYLEKIWYYGFLGRTAWLDSGLLVTPLAATYSKNLVNHETGVNDSTLTTPQPIEAYISSAEFDIDDGYKVGFIWRVLPDITFRGSTSSNPSVVMTLRPMQNSGSGYNDPESVGGVSNAEVTRSAVLPIEEFTGQINTRVRGRQMVMEVRSNELDVQWQLGSPRLDIRPDGRR